MKQAEIAPADLSLPPTAAHTIFRLLAQIVSCAVLAPVALFGTVVHYPAYRFAGYLSRRLARHEQDVLSTFKIISSMLLFPLTWIVVAVVSWRLAGWRSEEHTSELQSPDHLVCRLLLEKKKNTLS